MHRIPAGTHGGIEVTTKGIIEQLLSLFFQPRCRQFVRVGIIALLQTIDPARCCLQPAPHPPDVLLRFTLNDRRQTIVTFTVMRLQAPCPAAFVAAADAIVQIPLL